MCHPEIAAQLLATGPGKVPRSDSGELRSCSTVAEKMPQRCGTCFPQTRLVEHVFPEPRLGPNIRPKHLAQIGQAWPTFSQTSADCGQIGQHLVGLGQTPTSGQHRPIFVELGLVWPLPVNTWPISVDIGRNSLKTIRHWPTVGHCQVGLAKIGLKLGSLINFPTTWGHLFGNRCTTS